MTGRSSHSSENLYDILGVLPTASQQEIRKAYLKLSLRYHPDKNIDNQEAAKAQFIRVGQAYEILADPSRRADYDRSLRGSYGTYNRPQQQQQRPQQHRQEHRQQHGGNNQSHNYYYEDYYYNPEDFADRPQQQPQQQQEYYYDFFGTSSTARNGNNNNAYETYRQAFDTTMAGMSDDELRDVMSAASMIGGVLGSMIGSRLMGGSTTTNHNAARHQGSSSSMARNIGAIVGGLVASHAASALVETAHGQAKERVLLDQDRRARVARGEAVPEPLRSSSGEQMWKDLLQATADVVLQKTVAAIFQGGGRR
jgi:curved DNA-binding protein CbpA